MWFFWAAGTFSSCSSLPMGPRASGSTPSGVPELLPAPVPTWIHPEQSAPGGTAPAAPAPARRPGAPASPAPRAPRRAERSGAARSRGAGQGGQSPLPSGRLRRVAAPLSISLTSLPHALCFQYYTPAASWCLCFAASRERGRHCRCGCGWANARAAGRGAALSGAERSGEERSGTASRPPAPAAGSPGAAPRLGPGAPRWSLPRGSPASCSAARSACPPLPRGVPGTEVGARRVPRPFAASGLLASPCLRRRVPGSPPVSSHGCEPRGLLLLPNFFCGRFCRVSSCERRARTGTGIGMEMRTGTRSVVGGTAPCPPCRPCPTCTGQGSVLEFPVRDETHGSSSTCSSSRRLGRRRRPEVPGRPLAPLPVAARGVPVPSRPIPAAPRGLRATRSLTGLQSARRVLPLTLRALPKRLRALWASPPCRGAPLLPGGWAMGPGTPLHGRERAVPRAGGRARAAVRCFGEQRQVWMNSAHFVLANQVLVQGSVRLPYVSVCCANE